MKGKAVFIVGLAAGYVLGARAGRERYEQISAAWGAVWSSDPVQQRVEKVQDAAKARVSQLPGLVGRGVGSLLTKATGDTSAAKKVDRSIAEATRVVEEAAAAAEDAGEASSSAASSSKSSSKRSTTAGSKRGASGAGGQAKK